MTQLLGAGQITIGGQTWRTRKGATLDAGGEKRTSRPGTLGRVNGYTKETVQSKLEVTVDIDSAFSIDQIRALEDVDWTYEADTGQIWSCPNSWSTDTVVIDENEGTAKFTVEGDPVEEG